MEASIEQLWLCGPYRLNISTRPLVMGIVNVTPDSFSDGGQFVETSRAVDHALQLIAEGADILDIGGESTRPGATPVDEEEELKRVVPVIKALAQQTVVPLSIDTMKARVAQAAVNAGATIINDVSGFRNAGMIVVGQKSKAGLIVMHMPGTPQTMNELSTYGHVVQDVKKYLQQQCEALLEANVAPESLCIDPGIGFGKVTQQSLQLIAQLDELNSLGYPLCLGVSRKGFLGRITGKETLERMPASIAVACYAMAQGTAQILRVHDVAATVDAVKIMQAIRGEE